MIMKYQDGLAALKEKITNDTDRSEFHVYEQRLEENIDKVKFGDTPDTQSQRAEIISGLNTLAMKICGISFNDLCKKPLSQNGRVDGTSNPSGSKSPGQLPENDCVDGTSNLSAQIQIIKSDIRNCQKERKEIDKRKEDISGHVSSVPNTLDIQKQQIIANEEQLKEHLRYLQNKERFERDINKETQDRRKGQIWYEQSVSLLDQINLLKQKGYTDDNFIVQMMCQDIQRYLYDAVDIGFDTSETCYLLAKFIFDRDLSLYEARKYCNLSIKLEDKKSKDKKLREIYELGVKIYQQWLSSASHDQNARRFLKRCQRKVVELSDTDE